MSQLASRLHRETVKNGISYAKNLFDTQAVNELSRNIARLRGSEDPLEVSSEELPLVVQELIQSVGATCVRGHHLLLPPGGALHTDGGTIRQGVTLLVPLEGEPATFFHTVSPGYYGMETEPIVTQQEPTELYESAFIYGVGDLISLRQNYIDDISTELPPVIHGAYCATPREVLAIDIHQR